mmetsp:Transcript_13476/g.30887  ORF Transcript_13476/g.30887 Transcript_13476/m.30887 type:complete len:86 (+) Transcript_13476:145-402(+)
MAFFQRVFNYIANELLVEGLANSRTFQRFAVRTNEFLKDASKQAAEAKNLYGEQAQTMASQLKREVEKAAMEAERQQGRGGPPRG